MAIFGFMKSPDFIYIKKSKKAGEKTVMICIKNIIIDSEEGKRPQKSDGPVRLYMKNLRVKDSVLLDNVLHRLVALVNEKARAE